MVKLKKGYTTGVHTSFAFKSALDSFVATKLLSISTTTKMENDDLDVTKGCQIIVTISKNLDDLKLNQVRHRPYILKNKHNSFVNMKLYAGIGVGIVTKDGLKSPKDYPAINPVPLKALEDIFYHYQLSNINYQLFCSVSVVNGENLATKTANKKVGVIGGISILGTTGWVKPVSSSAYINSIETELNFAKVNAYDTVIFTLGNTAFKNAKETDGYIIEIGNFIYDGIKLAVSKQFKTIKLHIGIAKAVKIAQGFKNTHNRFGSIDFDIVQSWIKDIDISNCITIKRVRELLGEDYKLFDTLVQQKAKEQLTKWFSCDIDLRIIH